jgi:hypothetical protein
MQNEDIALQTELVLHVLDEAGPDRRSLCGVPEPDTIVLPSLVPKLPMVMICRQCRERLARGGRPDPACHLGGNRRIGAISHQSTT